MTSGGDWLHLEPDGRRRLRDVLFERGIEFPCGGSVGCGGCRIRVVRGQVAITPRMREVLTDAELAEGWRLACEADDRGRGPLTLEVQQWEPSILEDRDELAFEPAEGLGAVVDLGTTTVVVQLVDRATGRVRGVESSLNPQAAFGADLMARIEHDRSAPGELTRLIRRQVGAMLGTLARGQRVEQTLLVGNTVMHHLFAGLDLSALAVAPYRTPHLEDQVLDASALGWNTQVDLGEPARVLPCLGGFVGSDVLAGIVATGLHEADEPGALLDVGTNGEIAVGDRQHGIVVASTAAGPAFEGGRIAMGLRAGTGAIDRVEPSDDEPTGLVCRVIGNVPPRGVCGSGLVDAAAVLLDLGRVLPSGRLAAGPRATVQLAGSVHLIQKDLRELQLAKAALAAGLAILLEGRTLPAHRVHLAGAFGHHVRAASAIRIGLLPPWAQTPTASGNAALRGARALLLAPSRRDAILHQVRSRCRHVELAADRRFQEAFVEAMPFPDSVTLRNPEPCNAPSPP
jgi:uncharacterized 2Fe-2S/4Fe-4S cluster protein (DUF4445 family)